MVTLITDPHLERNLIEQRREWGIDRYDEVWEGLYMMTPNPNNEHQRLVMRLTIILEEVVGSAGLGEVLPGTNLAGFAEDWTRDYRCPDVAVFLRDTQAINCDTHWRGPADFLVEIISPGDHTREKMSFYEKIGVRELLAIDRDPWSLELYRHEGAHLRLIGRSIVVPSPSAAGEVPVTAGDQLPSQVVPLTFQLLPAQPRPQIRVTHPASSRAWQM